MAYQPGESTFSLSGSGEQLPTELSDRYFQNLDKLLQRTDKTQMDRTLGRLSDSGFLRSGDTFSSVAENVLGPSEDRRNAILLPELQRAAGQGREERLSALEYERKKEQARQAHLYALEELQNQAQIRRQLLELDHSLGGQQGIDWGQIGMAAAGSLAGGVSGKVGAGIATGVGNKLFGGSNTPAPTTTAPNNSGGGFSFPWPSWSWGSGSSSSIPDYGRD